MIDSAQSSERCVKDTSHIPSCRCDLYLFESISNSSIFYFCTCLGKCIECHLDVATAAAATLDISAKTGGPIVRLNDAAGSTLCTVVIAKEEMAAFDSLRSDLGETVAFQSVAAEESASAEKAATGSEGDNNDEEEETPCCRLVSGEELELELADMSTPVLLDAFARCVAFCKRRPEKILVLKFIFVVCPFYLCSN